MFRLLGVTSLVKISDPYILTVFKDYSLIIVLKARTLILLCFAHSTTPATALSLIFRRCSAAAAAAAASDYRLYYVYHLQLCCVVYLLPDLVDSSTSISII